MISCTKAASTMARVFHADQVADGLSDFETEGKVKVACTMNQSDDSYTSEDDGSMDDSDATASNSDASSTLESDSGDDRDGSRDGASTYGRGRGRGRCRGRPGMRRGRGGRGAHSAQHTGRGVRAGTSSISSHLYVWTTVREGTHHQKAKHEKNTNYRQACISTAAEFM